MLERFQFRSGSNENVYLTFEEALEQAINYIKEKPDDKYNVIVGSDSLYSPCHTVFATVFAVHRIGCGARFWYAQSKEKFPRNTPVRLMREAADSVEVMLSLLSSNIARVVPKNNFSVHVDVGEKGESRTVITEIIGYVTGQGLKCEYKPNSAVAANCADRLTKHISYSTATTYCRDNF
jgi:predicted RNase H-related nuclease YkuK (DUF458 family)